MLKKIIIFFIKRNLISIPIKKIRCEEKSTSLKEGWGGKHIKFFPPSIFFREYLFGNKIDAMQRMKDWYYSRLITDNLINISKNKGGMLGGTLFRKINEIHKLNGIDLNFNSSNLVDAYIKKGIDIIVEERFLLFESISNKNQLIGLDPIRVKKINKHYYIKNGHHRIATLYIKNYSEILAMTSDSFLLKFARKINYKL